MKLLKTILLRILAGLLILVLIAGAGGYAWLRGSLPQTSGRIKVAGIGGPVEILRDSEGIPHIRGASRTDALFGLGYAHAQDRLWQMEFQRRVGNGRLSEVLGQSTVSIDTFLRKVGTGRAAASAWRALPPESRKPVEAYIAGINAFISSHHGRELPIEFTILGFEPEPWRPEDVLVWMKMMAWNLGGTWENEVLRQKLNAKLGAEKAAELMPPYPADGTLILPDGNVSAAQLDTIRARSPQSCDINGCGVGDRQLAASDELLATSHAIRTLLGLTGPDIGSNNWVIGGSRTATGKPLLANDPHLGAQIPSIWYLAHVRGGDLDSIGATLPGVPAIVIGHNQRIAWGLTNTGPDVQDLYIERVNLANQTVEFNGMQEPLKVITEMVNVKGQPDVTVMVYITRHGPLIQDGTKPGEEPLALRWTALDEEDRTIDSLLEINSASNWEDFTRSLTSYKAPMQNIVYADVDNNIGYYAPGAVPIRAQGDGTLPVPGWTDAYDWIGYIPLEQLPHAYNPPQGFIATANNKVMPDNYPYYLGTDFAPPYRAARIVELITEKPKLTPEDIAAMLGDIRSGQVRESLPSMLAITPADERSKQALALLQNWDGVMRGDSAAAAIYQAYYQAIPGVLFADELGELFESDYSSETNFHALAVRNILAGRHTEWCDDSTTPAAEPCADRLNVALREGLDRMAKIQGSADLANWRWDRVHHVLFPHRPFDQVDALKSIFSRSIPNGGDSFTVNVAPPRRADFAQSHVPSYRQIVNLADLDTSRFIHTVGQSGNVLSGHYANFLDRWQRVEFIPMRYDTAVIDAAGMERLVLEP